MRHFITLSAILVFAMVSPKAKAQSGGFNVKNVNASEKVVVGSESNNTEISDKYISLPTLTQTEIDALTPEVGMLIYDTDSDIVKFYDGAEWKSLIPAVFCPSTVTDIDGNVYNTVLIGDQCWMAENLKVKKYPNGDEIPYTEEQGSWSSLGNNNTDDAYCYYGNNANSEYGVLYTYAAAIADNRTRDNAEGQGICPDGWHLPSDAEWTELTVFIGENAGTHLKSDMDWDGDNSSGFTALPGGFRNSWGQFSSANTYGYWWSATQHSESAKANRLMLKTELPEWEYQGELKSTGLSVRCIKD